jgi:DNA-binding response OmpR family regulator
VGVCGVPKGSILLIGGDEGSRQSIAQALIGRDYAVSHLASGEEGAAAARHAHPDLIILDSALPDQTCTQTCTELRAISTAPIIMLSTGEEDADIVLGLGVGADAYLIKPVSMPVLVAQVETAFRRETAYRKRQSRSKPLQIRDLIVDLAGCELRRNGAVIPLSPTEFRLMRALAENVGRVLSRSQLLDNVWETRAEDVYSRTVDVHIGRLRRKIEEDISSPTYIVTVAGMGYKLRDSE